MRGSLLVIGLICLLSGMLATTEVRADSDFNVTLIGSASPIPRPDRFGPSTLVEAGDQKFLIDAGRGAPIRLWQMKVPLGKTDSPGSFAMNQGGIVSLACSAIFNSPDRSVW
jgi:hypothetical protein